MTFRLTLSLPPRPAIRRWIIQAVLCMCLPVCVSPCAHQPSRRYSTEEILTMAPTVVYGTDIFHDRMANKLLLQVECVFKAEVPWDRLPVNFEVLHVVAPSSCSGTEAPAVGTKALFALLMDPQGQNDTGRYLPFEPEVLHNAIFPLTENILQNPSWSCDFSPHSMVEGACPAETEEKMEQCAKLAEVKAGNGCNRGLSDTFTNCLAILILTIFWW